jgi:DNA-binding MarR family transcriptional regulator
MTPRTPDPDPMADSVDRLIAQWSRARPDLDVSPVGVVARLARVRSHIDAELEVLFAQHGIGGPTFAVLATLVRLDDDAGVPQRRLMDELGLTSGTVSVRIDRLVRDGLVERRPDVEDRRNTRVVLTPRGADLVERVIPAHLDNERRMLAALDDGERDVLAGLLRRLLIEFEGDGGRDAGAGRLGMALAPAHVTLAMRRAVGLPPEAGLLVRAVEDGGPADRAGLAEGDVLVAAAGVPLRALGRLHAAVAAAGAGGRLDLEVVRGVDRRATTLELPPRPAG